MEGLYSSFAVRAVVESDVLNCFKLEYLCNYTGIRYYEFYRYGFDIFVKFAGPGVRELWFKVEGLNLIDYDFEKDKNIIIKNIVNVFFEWD